MVTAEEQVTYLAQQLIAMQTDVAELQNAVEGSATRYADLMVQLFTSEPLVRRVMEAGDQATAVMSRLQALETRSTGAMTSAAQRFRGKEATDYKPQAWSGENGSETFTAFKMELQNWVGSLHDNMVKVMDVAHAEEGRLMELDTKKTGISQETVDDFKDMDRRLYQVLISCTKGEAKNCVCKPESSGFMAARVTHTVSRERTDIIKTQDAAECQKHHADVGTRCGRI